MIDSCPVLEAYDTLEGDTREMVGLILEGAEDYDEGVLVEGLRYAAPDIDWTLGSLYSHLDRDCECF